MSKNEKDSSQSINQRNNGYQPYTYGYQPNTGLNKGPGQGYQTNMTPPPAPPTTGSIAIKPKKN